MSRRTSDSLFIGRLHKDTRVKDLEDIFESYGRVARCDIKYSGAEMAYGFIDFEDKRDAEDAMKYENGRSVCGSNIIVEWAKGKPRPGMPRNEGGGGREFSNECYNCHRPGHMARECPDGGQRGGGGGYQGNRGGGDRDRGSRGSYRPQQRDSSRGGRDRSSSPRGRDRSDRRRDSRSPAARD